MGNFEVDLSLGSKVVDFCIAKVPCGVLRSGATAKQICLDAVLMDIFALAMRSIPMSASTCRFSIKVILWKNFELLIESGRVYVPNEVKGRPSAPQSSVVVNSSVIEEFARIFCLCLELTRVMVLPVSKRAVRGVPLIVIGAVGLVDGVGATTQHDRTDQKSMIRRGRWCRSEVFPFSFPTSQSSIAVLGEAGGRG